MNQFCDMKGIKREFSVARTPQQNGVAERKNRTLIEAARTMLVDSKLPTTFWAEAVNTACYVLNRVLVIKPHNTTPYELIRGRPPLIEFMKPFGCPVTILNTRDHLGKFEGKANEGFFVGYSVVSKAMGVFNKRTMIVEETLNVRFLENAPNVKGNGPDWLFDVDSLTVSMNYVPVVAGNQTNCIAGIKDNTVAGPKESEENAGKKPTEVDECGVSDNGGQDDQDTRSELERLLQHEKQTEHINSTNSFNTVSPPISTVGPSFANAAPSSSINAAGTPVTTSNSFEEHLFQQFSPFKNAFALPYVPNVSSMDNTGIFGNAYDDEDVEEEVDMNNVISSYSVSDAPFTKFHKDHPENQVIGSLETPIQTRHMNKINKEHGLISSIQKLRRTNHKDFQNCLFACFLSQMEPKKPVQALKDPSWVEAMQDELLQFKLLKVWTLVDLPKDKWAIGTKWVFRNKKDERGIVVKNKARLVAQGHTQEEGIDYDEVFAPVARIEAIRLFLDFASFQGFVVYQMDVKSAFLYGKIEEEVYVCQPPGFEDPDFPDKVYKVEKALYGLHQAQEHVQVYVDDIIFGSTKKELSTEFEKLMHDKFQMSSMGELSFFLGLQVQQKSDGIFISQDKYVAEILKKFDFATIKTASSPMDPNKALIKDEEAENVDVHLYRSMIGSLMYLTASRPDITFAVCACARFQVTPKTSHLHAVKRIFRYLKVANSNTEAEYVDAANCCGQVLWIQNQMLDYGFNFMNTKIYIDNESTICIVKNPVFHSKTKHIEIRHHFIRDSYEKKLIQVIKIHTDQNVADLLTLMIAMAWRCFLDEFEVKTDETVHKERGDRMERDATTTSSLEAEQDSDSGEVQITATIDGKVKFVFEASIRRHLKLEDSDGISTLPNTKIFEKLALMGYASDSDKLTFQKGLILQGEGSTIPVESHHTPSGDPTISQPPLSSPSRVLALENDLQQTNKVYSTAIIKLIMKVKRLEKIVKSSKVRRRANIVISNDDMASEDSSKQGRMIEDIDEDAGITLVTPTKASTQDDQPKDQLGVLSVAKVLADAARVQTYSRRRRAISTGSGGVSTTSRIISTAEETVSTAGATMPVSTPEDEWENIKARVKADEELTQKLQAEEREKYSEVDQAKMLVDLINQRKRFFAQQRAEAKRNKLMT
ncbi:putative ribonuclease H-like domain-containing protein [Tanacetum coccineum]